MNRQQKADYAALKFCLRAVELGVVISKPSSECGVAYDFIADIESVLHRVQVKWGGRKTCHAEGSVCVPLDGSSGGKKYRKGYTKEAIDAVVVYVPQVDKVVWVPPNVFDGKSSLTFRFNKPKNGQKAGIRLLEDFIW